MIHMLYASIILMFLGLINLVLSRSHDSQKKSYLLLFVSVWHLCYFSLASYQRYEFFLLILIVSILLLRILNEQKD